MVVDWVSAVDDWATTTVCCFLSLCLSKALAVAMASIMKVAVMKLINARITSSMVAKTTPALLKALGRVKAPTPTMRLKTYTNANCNRENRSVGEICLMQT